MVHVPVVVVVIVMLYCHALYIGMDCLTLPQTPVRVQFSDSVRFAGFGCARWVMGASNQNCRLPCTVDLKGGVPETCWCPTGRSSALRGIGLATYLANGHLHVPIVRFSLFSLFSSPLRRRDHPLASPGHAIATPPASPSTYLLSWDRPGFEDTEVTLITGPLDRGKS